MNDCTRTDELVVDFLDDALIAADRDAFERHLATCGACRETVGSYRAIRSAYREAAEHDAPDAAARAILAAARETSAPLARRPVPFVALALAAAAALLLAWVGGRLFGDAEPVHTPSSVELVERGDEHRAAGRLDAAAAAYERALAMETDDARARLLHRAGAVYLELGDARRALELLDELAANHLDYDERGASLLLYGRALERTGEAGLALQTYRRVAREFPSDRSEAQRLSTSLEVDVEALGALGYVE